ncbi:MAG: hypothetical protein IKG98_06200 [Ruminococcus sp.]|nr:hypothetical protein [Ruminococcus sp.]
MDTSADDPIHNEFELVKMLFDMILLSFGAYLVLTLISLAAMCILYKKAGERGWTAFVPIYNIFQMSKIATGSFRSAALYSAFLFAYILLLIMGTALDFVISYADWGMLVYYSAFLVRTGLLILIVGEYMALCYRFTQSFDKSAAMCRLSMFFSPIIFMIMGFNPKTEYIGPQ